MTHPYASDAYAQACAFTSEPFWCKALGCWLFPRPIPGTAHYDARGLYPFSPTLRFCERAELARELSPRGLVSVVLVTDALQPNAGEANDTFDFVREYKDHFVIDLEAGAPDFSKHHRQEVRRARRKCETRIVNLHDHLDDWCALYDELAVRREFSRLHQFPRSYFDRLAEAKGFSFFGAFVDGKLVSGHIWLRHGRHAYSHLAASSEDGYACGAAYAIYAHAIEHYSDCARIDMGGVADTGSGQGLAFFKRGFSNETRRNRLCGIVLDKEINERLSAGVSSREGYFPSYRDGFEEN